MKYEMMDKIFSENEIMDIYNTHIVKDSSYFDKVNNKYQSLSNELKFKWYDKDFSRLASIFDFEDWIEKYNLKKVNKLLSTCETDDELTYIQSNVLDIIDYSKNKEYDLHTLNLKDKDYDLIIFNQTLEHLYNPFLAMKKLYEHLKPNGHLYTTVPIINIPHMVPFHFWGITPIGLCILSKNASFDILECGYWGNLEYINHLFTSNSWTHTNNVMNCDGVIKNVNHCQSQTWVLLKKL